MLAATEYHPLLDGGGGRERTGRHVQGLLLQSPVTGGRLRPSFTPISVPDYVLLGLLEL